jgi:hypothetical protein
MKVGVPTATRAQIQSRSAMTKKNRTGEMILHNKESGEYVSQYRTVIQLRPAGDG